MINYSANLGFLWTELSLPDAIKAAAQYGFAAVECHFPYATPPPEVSAALRSTGLKMLGLNTIKGSGTDNGLCALPDRVSEARAAIDQAIEYAVAIGAQNVHVMAGIAEGAKARTTYLANLQYATDQAKAQGVTILIEPLNPYDAPGYFLHNTTQAVDIINTVAADNLKLMFDCYHVQIIEGNVSRRMKHLQSLIGHIQIASVPDRSEPDCGELNYHYVLSGIKALGYTQPIGAEYRPKGTTEAGLQWMRSLAV